MLKRNKPSQTQILPTNNQGFRRYIFLQGAGCTADNLLCVLLDRVIQKKFRNVFRDELAVIIASEYCRTEQREDLTWMLTSNY